MSTKRSPRAMPMETIITRYKSRNQQFVNKRHKIITKSVSSMSKPEPLKQNVLNVKDKISTKKFQKSLVKSNDNDNREFYPDKPKRKIDYKKVVLLPKHCMKMVGGTKGCNKRKLHMPQKEIKRTRRNSNFSTLSNIEPESPKHEDRAPELTMKDMVLLIEEEGGLNDEDLLEILTCPSPVWWEDPPNGYIEDPIFTRPKPEEQKSIKKQLLEEQDKEAERRKQRDEESTLKAKDTENLDVSKLGIRIGNCSVNFMNKRCKLESLLGSIRNKVKLVSDSFKEGNKNINDDAEINANAELNANCNRENDENIECTSNNNQSAESKQQTVVECVTAELNMKHIEKCIRQVDNANKNQTIELKPKNIEYSHKNVHSESNSKLCASFKMKKFRNRNKIKRFKTELKETINIDRNLHSNTSEDHKLESVPVTDANCDKKNIDHEDIIKVDREKRNSDSFEEDNLLDLDDHELCSLENIKIPIAPTVATNPIKITETINKLKNETDNSNTNDVLLDNRLGIELNSNNTKKEKNCVDKIIPVNKLITEGVKKYIDIKATNPKIKHLSLVKNTNNRVKDTNKKNTNKLSFIRVRKIDILPSLNRNRKVDISRKTLSNNGDITKTCAATESDFVPAVCKDILLHDTAPVKMSNLRNENFHSKISNLVNESKDACNINTVVTNDILSEIKSTKKINTRLSEINKPVIADDNISINHGSDEACIEIEDDDLDDHINDLNNSSLNSNIVSDKLIETDSSILIKNKITENRDQDKSTHCNSINNTRRYSVDSATSEKNMSVEYLDMSILDEDERKSELESRNNEFNCESDDCQSKSDSQTCTKNNHINFKSDLDTTDSNMYDQINESCNNDIINYIRFNQKDIDTTKDKDVTNSKRLSNDLKINDNFESLSPVHEKAISNETKESENVGYCKIINSACDKEGNFIKINEIKSVVVNENNDASTIVNAMQETTVNEGNKGNVMEINEIDDSEFTTYEEEYLTEFDEMDVVGNDNNDGNFIKIDEIRDGVISRNNEVNEVVTENVHNKGKLIIMNAENSIEKLNVKGDSKKINEVSPETALNNQDNSSNDDTSKINDTVDKHVNNYHNKHRKDVRNNKIISDDDKSKKENDKNIDINKTILIAENDTMKYCRTCTSIYDTDNCEYCIKKLKTGCKNVESEYVCDKCNTKVGDKEAIIEHLKWNCKIDNQ